MGDTIQQKIDQYVLESHPVNQRVIRDTLENPYEVLRRMKNYVRYQAEKRKEPAWAVISDMTSHGSQVSFAIWKVLMDTETND